MPRKKRAPINKLREVNYLAEQFLVEKGIRRPEHQSVIKTILSTKDAPPLPGIPPYLPTPWAINNTKKILLSIGKEWSLINKQEETGDKVNNLDAFIKFIFKVLREEDQKINSLIQDHYDLIQYGIKNNISLDDKTVAEWLKPLIEKEALQAVTAFILDSLAVCLAVNAASDVPEFFEWFNDWTEKLKMYWPENLRNIDGKNDNKILTTG